MIKCALIDFYFSTALLIIDFAVKKLKITEIVNNAIVADKNQDKDRWFDTLWVKISAGVSVLSFIAFFTVKIVVTLLAL